MMRALVTGGAGFIGSHIAETLCARGAQVTVLDNLSSGSLQNLAWGQGNGALEFVQGDIRDTALVCRLIANRDVVFHEAALPSVPYSVAHPVETEGVNSTATLQLLVAARDAGVKRFFFASSSAVYGDSESLPKRESDAPAPISPYGLQKYASERYAQLFWRLYGLATISFRYFNVFGPRQRHDSPYSGVIARFCSGMENGQRPVIHGDGLQSRDFVFVENIVDAHLWALEASAEKVSGCVFNLGTGSGTNLLQLAEEINLHTGQRLTPRHEPARAADIRHSVADISAARNAFGYEPRISLREGLRRTLAVSSREQPGEVHGRQTVNAPPASGGSAKV